MTQERNSTKLEALRLQAVLVEYQALKTEHIQKFRHHLVIFSILIPAVAVIFGSVVTKKTFDLLLLLPIVSASLAFRYIWEQSVIIAIGHYISDLESDVFPKLLGARSTGEAVPTPKLWVGWEHYFESNFKRLPFYKYTTQLLFVIVPFTPSFMFGFLVVIKHYCDVNYDLKTLLPVSAHIVLLVLYLILAIYLAMNLWKPEKGFEKNNLPSEEE